MAHCSKFVRAATGGMFIHYDRTTNHQLSNQEIDSSRTHLNYNLAYQDQPLAQSTFLKKRLGEVRARRQSQRQTDSRPANRERLSEGSNSLSDGSNGRNQGRAMG